MLLDQMVVKKEKKKTHMIGSVGEFTCEKFNPIQFGLFYVFDIVRVNLVH